VVAGTLEQPYRGPDVDVVLHAAASVSVVRGYRSMRAANVTGTGLLLALGLPTHHISTLAVATAAGFVAAHPGLRDGYQRSKWVAEELVRQAGERGIPVAVHRLGRVVGAADTGYVNPADLVWRILRAGVPRGVLPDLDLVEPWTPVDWVAGTIVAAATGGATGVHNLAPERCVRFGQLVDWVIGYGFDVTVLPLDRWCERVRSDAGPDDLATLAYFDRAATGAAPATGQPPGGWPPGSGPAVGRSMMHRYLDHAVASGLLPDRST
jgi:nonribosomal peptide synthetase MxcG